MRYVFAGDRDIAIRVLRYLLHREDYPEALLVSEPGRATHADELRELCDHLPADRVLEGTEFRTPDGVARLRALECDVMVSIHFPYIVPSEVLGIPRVGVLNLHPAFLPFNRGWHTPSWAILDGSPIGATLHLMDRGLDTGDIVHQRELAVEPSDTADSLYQRIKDLEFQVFQEAWPTISAGTMMRIPQDPDAGSAHRSTDLLQPEIQRLDLDESVRVADLMRRLRALTTNRPEEAAYFEVDGRRFRVQVRITEG